MDLGSSTQTRRRGTSTAGRRRIWRQRLVWAGFVAALVAGLLFLVALWHGGKPAFWRAWEVSGTVKNASEHIERKEWVKAASLLGEAMRIAPNDPAVLRTVAEFQLSTHASHTDVVQTLKHLLETGNATTQDMVKLGHAEIRSGNLDAARKTLLLLPPAERSRADVIELESTILKVEGQDHAADDRLRVALLAQDADANAPLRLAILDFKQPYPDVHVRGRSRLWEFARGKDDGACRAVQVLAADSALTPEEANDLMRLTQIHPKPGLARLVAVQAALRLHPQEHDAILTAETARAGGGDNDERMQFARWLSALKEHEWLLKFLPPEAMVKSKDLPAEILNLKLDAMAHTNRWEDVDQILTPALEKTLGKISFNLWHACVAAKVKNDPEKVRQHLTLAFEFSDRGKNTAGAIQTAETAARLGVLDLAATYYHELSGHVQVSQTRLAMLEKSFAMHGRNFNTSAMLQVAREISRLTPSNETAAFRADYLALLVGDSLELVAAKAGLSSSEPGTEAASRAYFLKALADFRLRQPVTFHDLPQRMETSASWTAGHRAVLAAIMATNGELGEAFRIAERVPVALLLPEEIRLLKLAR